MLNTYMFCISVLVHVLHFCSCKEHSFWGKEKGICIPYDQLFPPRWISFFPPLPLPYSPPLFFVWTPRPILRHIPLPWISLRRKINPEIKHIQNNYTYTYSASKLWSKVWTPLAPAQPAQIHFALALEISPLYTGACVVNRIKLCICMCVYSHTNTRAIHLVGFV